MPTGRKPQRLAGQDVVQQRVHRRRHVRAIEVKTGVEIEIWIPALPPALRAEMFDRIGAGLHHIAHGDYQCAWIDQAQAPDRHYRNGFERRQRNPDQGDLVAGTGFEPVTFRL